MFENVYAEFLERLRLFSSPPTMDDGKLALLVTTGIMVAVYYSISTLWEYVQSRKASFRPMVGYRHFLEPTWLLGMRFTRHSREMIAQGYHQFKNSAFKVRCNDTDIVVLSHRFVDELRSLPEAKASSPQALYNKGVGTYTGLGIILESRLHIETIQKRLTPSLTAVLDEVKDELDHALALEMPACTDNWVSMDMHTTLARLISRLSSRVFGGMELARNEEWIDASTKYPENAFATAMLLRMVPRMTRPALALCLPHFWRTQANIACAKRLVGAMVNQRRVMEDTDGELYDRPNDLLQWMMDAADPHDATASKIAHRLLFVSDASVMTTSLLTTQCIYDLCAHPEYFEILRQEILSVLREGGSFQKTMLHKMKKLDSCLKESQRLNPPFLLTFDRILHQDLTLSDGTSLRAGTHIAMATDAILRDPEFLPPGSASPDEFDPLRYYRARQDPSQPENAQRFQFVTTEITSLPFGHGKYACPGRFFASSEAKLILCHMLLLYDFEFKKGQTRPQNLLFSENLVPDPKARVLVRKRKTADQDLAHFALSV
ncbi:hypothetical protein LMH87_011180 [Akanthomyces muscarius]|uniref:P450 monooxygenase n=1 Tax=Akanthomyces muscarius TaxID=2231603 RepID=A0A9W8Q971_AKAMU|nr:hypothetical protein LMH87_011180 [Akanthomyces muscarius]KAJ4150430.1 hypothetical protein LMH87_011180 [Akanthomyces muscarius]